MIEDDGRAGCDAGDRFAGPRNNGQGHPAAVARQYRQNVQINGLKHYGQGFIATASMKRTRKSCVIAARELATTLSSQQWRRMSETSCNFTVT
jgi:hypothetical protein